MAEPRKDEETEHANNPVEYFEADGERGGKRWVESGELSDVDDQTIAPPG